MLKICIIHYDPKYFLNIVGDGFKNNYTSIVFKGDINDHKYYSNALQMILDNLPNAVIFGINRAINKPNVLMLLLHDILFDHGIAVIFDCYHGFHRDIFYSSTKKGQKILIQEAKPLRKFVEIVSESIAGHHPLLAAYNLGKLS